MHTSLEALAVDDSTASIDQQSPFSILACLQWQSAGVQYSDEILLENLVPERDRLPATLAADLAGKQVGDELACRLDKASGFVGWQAAQLHSMAADQFDRYFRGLDIEPCCGRFYPRILFRGLDKNPFTGMQPARLVELDAQTLRVDCNPPLSAHEVELQLSIVGIDEPDSGSAAPARDLLAECSANGPGMQARWQQQPTDFFTADAFARADAADDALFYQQPRIVDHLDASCRAQISALYDRLLPPGSKVLDMMSSWTSHLPTTRDDLAVTGLGMNATELQANLLLQERLVHDLNREPALPFEDHSFDAAICTASIEYLVRPDEVIAELARILRPGAPLVITFSNRCFPPKAIQAWSHSHDFEHLGLVNELLLRQGDFERIHNWTLRQLPRPADDPYLGQLSHADPVFAVWGWRQSTSWQPSTQECSYAY